MNERIEHLMYQAGLTAQGCWDKLDDYDRTAIEKFAELIVRECADVAAEHEALDIYEEIREHFGVEE
jgi:TRAP-type C4-dicarboxylate transport system substrate-binding protein